MELRSHMSNTPNQTLLDTLAMRQHAERILDSLLRARAECDQCLQREQRSDPMRSVTGSSSLDRAIVSTRRMIDTLNRAIEEAARESGAHAAEVQVTLGRASTPVQ